MRKSGLATVFALLAGAGLGQGSAVAQEEIHDCVIKPAVLVKIGSPVSGLVARIDVARGDPVERGQVVAWLRSEIEEANVAVIREEVESRAAVEAQEARLALAESQLARTRKLVDRKITAAGQLDEIVAQVEVIRRELAMAEMRGRVAELELRRAEARLQQRQIVSPIDGVVTERALFEGEFLHQEQHLLTVAQLDPLHVEAFLPVTLYGQIGQGMSITITPDAPVTGTYPGRIDVIDKVFDAASSTFGIRVLLDNPGSAIPAGHRCKLSFQPS